LSPFMQIRLLRMDILVYETSLPHIGNVYCSKCYHSIIASVIAECASLLGQIGSPQVKQSFRLMVIVLSLVSFPIYQFLVPRRGDVISDFQVCWTANRWFFIERWGSMPIFIVFTAILAITVIIFIIQELFPILSDLLRQMRATTQSAPYEVDSEIRNKVAEALDGLPFDDRLSRF